MTFLTNMLLVAALLFQAQSPPPKAGVTPAPAQAAAPAAADQAEYRIGPEDILALFVWQNADLSRTVQVRPDGRISLPLVNDVNVVGLTPMQLRETLMQRYKEFDKAVELSVIVQDVNNFKVTLLGKVNKPGRYRLRAPTTVLELLGEAGGLAEYADEENIVILRAEPLPRGRATQKTYGRIRFSYKKVTQAGGETANIALLPDDIVLVP